MAPIRCTVCGKPPLYRCKYCGDSLCKEHYTPDMHWCIGVEDYNREVEEGKISPIPSEAEPEEPRNNEDGENTNKSFSYSFGIFTGNYSFLLLFLITGSFVLQLLIPGGIVVDEPPSTYEKLLWLDPELIDERPWTLVTHIFLHGSFWHFLFNMFFLLFFAAVLEKTVGSLTFLIIFFLSGIVAGIGWSLTAISPMVGASGALYGIFGALAAMMPRTKMYIFPLPILLEMWMMAILFAVINFLMIGTDYPIAFTAHLSGLFFGLFVGIWLVK